MSTNRVTLDALVRHTQKELRYFELVALRFEGRTDQIFLCIGKHALHFVKRSLSGMYLGEKGGEVFFAHVERLVEDEQSDTDLLIIMTNHRPSEWPSEQLFVVSENRTSLVEHLTVAWQTDHAWRMGRMMTLPRSIKSLRKRAQSGLVTLTPFLEHQQVYHQGFSIFLPDQYKRKNMQRGNLAAFVDKTRELEFFLRVEEPEDLEQFGVTCHDHIRWVATDFRQAVTENLSEVLLLRNAFYMKKMNLANDIACWTGWEVMFKSESIVMAAIFLRRQFIPPILDAVQDMSIILSCPIHVLADGIMDESDMLFEVRNVADSVTPRVQDCTQHQTLYRDMIQAKLDTLLFPEDALTWLDSVFALQRGDYREDRDGLALRRPTCEMEAWTFLKSIMSVLQEEAALSNPEVLNMCPNGLPVLSKPLTVCDLVMDKADHMRDQRPGTLEERHRDPFMNAWMARAARFFAHCVDGFLLGKRFTLCDVAGVTILAEKTRSKIDAAILFMLHTRPQDMTQPFTVIGLRHLLHDPSFFSEYTFNDRVMQSLLELGWIARHLSPASTQEEESSPNVMSLDYASFLAQMLVKQETSNNLKGAICRQIISNPGSQLHLAVLLPAVMETLRQRSLYLKTYATVTFVNLSRGHDVVKHALMKERVGKILTLNFKLQDDDLTYYSLVLLSNLTKLAHHREELFKHNKGITDILVSLLRSSMAGSKRQVLAETTAAIGQLCLDDHFWEAFCGEGVTTINILLDIHEEAEVGSKVKSKAMLAIRQITTRSRALPPHLHKDVLGQQLLPKLAAEIQHLNEVASDLEENPTFDVECACNAVHLLFLLSHSKKNCDLMLKEDLIDMLEELMASPLCDTDGMALDDDTASSTGKPLLPDTTCEQISQVWQTLHGRYLAEGQVNRPPTTSSRSRSSSVVDTASRMSMSRSNTRTTQLM